MTPVDGPVRPEGDDTPRPPMTVEEAEGWLDYWETVGLSSDPAALDEREAARLIRAELARLRGIEGRARDLTDAGREDGHARPYRHAARFILGEETEARDAAARSATHPETTEH